MKNEVQSYTVGKYYIIRCVRDSLLPMGWLPTYGAAHADADLGVAERHYHIDYRFLTKHQIRRFSQIGWRPADMEIYASVPLVKDCEVKYMRRKCQREHAFSFDIYAMEGPWPAFIRKWAGKKMKRGNICPHRGAVCYATKAGFQCPMHGLRFDKNGIAHGLQDHSTQPGHPEHRAGLNAKRA